MTKTKKSFFKKLNKKILKSRFAYWIIARILYLYMYLIYFTSKWEYHVPEDFDRDYYKNICNAIYVSWHDKIMVLPHISPFHLHRKLHALVSPHNDGRIISSIMKMIGYRIIEGSSNKNSMQAVKHIIKNLKNSDNVVITPDGPRGPRHQMKGNLIEIAKKTNSVIIPFTASSNKYINLNSWDKLIFPLPFGRINVHFGKPIECSQNTDLSNKKLAKILNELDSQ